MVMLFLMLLDDDDDDDSSSFNVSGKKNVAFPEHLVHI